MSDKNDVPARKNETSRPEKSSPVKADVHQLNDDELSKVAGGQKPQEEMKK